MSISRFKQSCIIVILQLCFTGDVHIFGLYRLYIHIYIHIYILIIMGIGYHIHLALVFSNVAQFVTDVYDWINDILHC